MPSKKDAVVLALRCQAAIIVHLLRAIPTCGLGYDHRDSVLEQLRALAERELTRQESPV